MKTSKDFLRAFTLTVIVSVILTSCGTIFSGGAPIITIDGDVKEPVNIVTEKQAYYGVELPVDVRVNRHHLNGQRIKITSENYKFNDIILGKTVNGWTFANILLGGLIGWGIDLGTNCVSTPSQSYFVVTPVLKTNPKDNSDSTPTDGQ